jgi:transcriptional regulator with XRE-family HTH domain
MLASQKLKALRDSRNITIREVELESRRIADAKSDRRFYISNARLTQLENDPSSEPSLWKLFTLSAVYQVGITELMRLYNVDADESDRYNAIARPGDTRLLSELPEPDRIIESLKSLITFPEKTTLLPRVGSDYKPTAPPEGPESQLFATVTSGSMTSHCIHWSGLARSS